MRSQMLGYYTELLDLRRFLDPLRACLGFQVHHVWMPLFRVAEENERSEGRMGS